MQDTADGHRSKPAPLAPIPEAAVAAIDALQRAILLDGARVIAVAAPHPSPAARRICGMLAQSLAASGVRTLLVDASSPVDAGRPATDWQPGQPIPADTIRPSGGVGGPDVLAFAASRRTRPMFNNIDRLAGTFRDDLADYAAIVLQLPPVLAASEKHIDPVSLACAADTAYLVCSGDETTAGEILKAKAALDGAGVTIAGTLLDASRVNPPGPEMAEMAQTWLPLPRRLRRRIADYLRTSSYFNDLP